MPRVTCAFCGLPFSVRHAPEGAQHFCCSGCALASRIPVHGEALPVSRGLVIALALGFGLFNQLLFAIAGTAIAAEGRADVGARMLAVSAIVGAALVVANTIFLLTTRARHWSDGVAGVITLAVVAWAGVRGWRDGLAGLVWPLLVANGWFALWWSRGWLRRAFARWRGRGAESGLQI